jgi:hypothetical protein
MPDFKVISLLDECPQRFIFFVAQRGFLVTLSFIERILLLSVLFAPILTRHFLLFFCHWHAVYIDGIEKSA